VDLGAVFAAEATRPLVVCDIDNVLAQEVEAGCTAVNARFGSSHLVSDMRAYPYVNLFEPDQKRWLLAQSARDPWILNLAPDREAIAALRTVRASGHRVLIASDRPASTAPATEKWLDASAVPRDGQILDGPTSKTMALAARGPMNPAVLIDDDPAKWLTIARPGVDVWTPIRPWTPQSWRQYPNVRAFADWTELLTRLETR